MRHWKLRGVTGLAPTHSAGRENLNPDRTDWSSFLCPSVHHSDSLDVHLSPADCQLFGSWTPFSSVDTDLYSSEVLNKRKTLSSVEEAGKSREDSADVFKCGLCCLLHLEAGDWLRLVTGSLSCFFICQMRTITERFSLSGGECRARHCICLAHICQ